MSDLDADRAGIPYAKQQAIVHVAQACASLSFLGSTVIIVAYFRFKQLRTYSFQLVCWLAVCDIAVNLSFFLGSPSDGSGLCYAQGFLQRFFQVALIQWTLLIAQSLLVVSSKTRTFDGDKRMPWNHVWAWGVSAILSVIPLSTGSFGRTEGPFCCVDGGDSWTIGSLWRAIFLVMVFASMVAIVWAYAEVVKNLSQAQQNVFRLSLHATANRYEEASTTKQQLGSPATANPSGQASATSVSTTSHLKANGEVTGGLPPESSSQEQTTAPMGLFGGGKEVSSSQQKRPSRRDSLWKRIILGSIMEGSEECSSVDRSRRQQSLFESNRISSQSSIYYTRSNSNVSVKDWLWSTSRDMGFFEDIESLDRSSEEEEVEEECQNVLWLNGMASPAKRRLSSALLRRTNSAPIASTPKRLPTLKATKRGSSRGEAVVVTKVTGEIDDAVYGSPESSTPTPTMKWRNLFPTAKTTAKVEAAASTDSLEPAPLSARLPRPLPAVKHAAAASLPDQDGGHASSPGSSVTLGRASSHFVDPLVAPTTARRERSMSNPGGTASATPQRLIKSRFVNGVDRARGYVRRMSSLDTDHGRLPCENSVIFQRGRRKPADTRGRGRGKITPGQSVSGATTPMGAHQQPLPTKRAPEKDMDRFISRIKWYPVIYVLTWMIPLINGIYTISVGQSSASFSLVLLAAVTSRLQGLLNFICYGLNDQLKQAWLQDFMYRRAVASCCRALWCCCFGPCNRHDEGGDEGGGDLDDAERTRPTDDEQQGSSALNSFADVDLADEIEKGESLAVMTVPPVASETPPRTPLESMATLYATPHHSVRQGRPSLAPARPARPDRKASTGRHTSARSAAAAGSGSRRKKTAKSTATDPAVGAAAGIRRQRALVGQVRTTSGRKHKNAVEPAPADDDTTPRSIHGSRARKKAPKPNDSRKKRHNYRRLERTNGGSSERTRGSPPATRVRPALSPALPIAISMPVLTTAGAVSGRHTTGATGAGGKIPRLSHPKDGGNGSGIRYLGEDDTFSSSDSSEEISRRVGESSRREARRSGAS
eukprot:g4830.t1